MSNNPQQSSQQQNAKTVRLMLLIVIGMFGFGFAMVPLYDLLCSVTGLNGSTTGRIQDVSQLTGRVDYNRVITVEFDATNNADLPWEFRPTIKKLDVHPGEIKEVSYFVKNNASHAIVAQAIPGITPWQATSHFNKTECFCFIQQKLEPGEGKEMALRFVIDPDLPKEYKTITLSYTFMDTDRSKLKQNGEMPKLQTSVTGNLPNNNI
ncbi:MAG: cytochrome c oxidase assembly protein [Gammaproteobacteria bacterium]|nr:cytochrome c oxidase assembly protein [Gammaproteobacteria bacterium]